MRKAICTFGVGPHSEILRLTRGPMLDYARRHGYSFVDASVAVEKMDPTVPPSWRKLNVLRELLGEGFEWVLWLDADILVVEPKEDILARVPERTSLAFACHEVPGHGYTPNAGLLLASSVGIVDALEEEARSCRFSSRIWEQAGLWKMCGIDPDAHRTTRATEPERAMMVAADFYELGHRWNYCFMELRGIPRNLRFVHFAGGPVETRAERIAEFQHSPLQRELLEGWTAERLEPWFQRGTL